jgi:hypothetical protein
LSPSERLINVLAWSGPPIHVVLAALDLIGLMAMVAYLLLTSR